jgi:hypothetical protein
MTNKEKYTFLNSKKEILEESILKLNTHIRQKCVHGVECGELFPYPYVCFKCAINYYKYCKKNFFPIDEVIFREVAQYITNEDKERERQKAIVIEEKKKKEELERLNKRNNQLFYYKNKSNLDSEEIGKRYERYIGYLLESRGFKVEYHGILNKKADRGIDIIATNKKTAYIIQCKRYAKTKFIHENTINQLIGTYSSFKRRNSSKFSEIRAILYTAHDNLDEHALETLHAHMEIQHIVEPYFEHYPMVKCNIGNNGEKIYHVPDDAMYDHIKIEIHKGECYCYSEAEAEAKGFRRTER